MCWIGLAERTPSGLRERCLGVRGSKRGGGAPVDAFRQLRDGGGAFHIEQPAVAVGCRRQPGGNQIREHVTPRRPDPVDQAHKLRPTLLDHADLVAATGRPCPGKLGEGIVRLRSECVDV